MLKVMTSKEKKFMAGAMLIFILSCIVSLFSGHYGFSVNDALDVFWKVVRKQELNASELTLWRVLIDLRFSRLLATCLAGAMLAAAGVLSQGLFRNALAAPSVLGVTSGASFFAAMFFYLGWGEGMPAQLAIASVFGSLVVLGMLHAFFKYFQGSVEIIIFLGIALNTIFGALTSFVVMFLVEDYQRAPQIMQWIFGGVANRHWTDCLWTMPILFFALIAGSRIALQLDVLSFGQLAAQSMGVAVKRLHFWTITWIAVLVGAAVAIVGGVSFVGLIVPHVGRMMIGARNLPLLLFSAVNGASLLILSDVIARTLRPSAEIPLGVLTALLGGPFFLTLIVSRMRGKLSQ